MGLQAACSCSVKSCRCGPLSKYVSNTTAVVAHRICDTPKRQVRGSLASLERYNCESTGRFEQLSICTASSSSPQHPLDAPGVKYGVNYLVSPSSPAPQEPSLWEETATYSMKALRRKPSTRGATRRLHPPKARKPCKLRHLP